MPEFMDPNMPAQPQEQRVNPWVAFAGGAAAGAAGGTGAYLAYAAVKKAMSRANWALGISIGIGALTLLNSSNLQTDQNNWQAAAVASNALTFTAAAVTGAEAAAMRAVLTNVCNIGGKTAYDANIWNWFITAPQAQTIAIPAAVAGTIPAIPAIAAVNNTNNQNLLALVAVVGVAALVIMT